MKRFAAVLITTIISISTFATETTVVASDLANTCWLNSIGGLNGKTWFNFVFRNDGSGELRRVEKGRGATFVTEFVWSITDSKLSYVYREPQTGYGPGPGNGRSVRVSLKEDGKELYFANMQNGTFWHSPFSCPFAD